MHGWIFLGGPDFDGTALWERPQSGDLVFCADSGYARAREMGIVPDLLLGDFDSLAAADAQNADALGIRRLTVPAHKDDTDTQLAIEEAISRGCTQLTLVGGFGGRVDHFGANLLQLEGYRRRGVKIRLMNGQNRVRCAISESVTLCAKDGYTYFGVLALTDTAKVSIAGAAYPLTHKTLRRDFPYAVSNEFAAPTAEITVHTGAVLIAESERKKPDADAKPLLSKIPKGTEIF